MGLYITVWSGLQELQMHHSLLPHALPVGVLFSQEPSPHFLPCPSSQQQLHVALAAWLLVTPLQGIL